METISITVWTYSPEGFHVGERDIDVPAKYEVCSRCRGKGKHDHPAFSNGITSDEWNGPDWDDDSREAYRRGDYDVPCEKCSGERVVLTADHDAIELHPDREAILAHFDNCRAQAEERESEIRYGY